MEHLKLVPNSAPLACGTCGEEAEPGELRAGECYACWRTGVEMAYEPGSYKAQAVIDWGGR